MKWIIALGGTSSIFLFLTVVHFSFFKPEKMIGAVACDAGLSIMLMGFILIKGPYASYFKTQIPALTWFACSFFLGAMLFAVLGPFMVERSLTVFLLHEIAGKGPTGVKVEKMVHLTESGYIKNDHMAKKRLVELENGGHIAIINNQCFITSKGKWFAQLYLGIQRILQIKSDFLISN